MYRQLSATREINFRGTEKVETIKASYFEILNLTKLISHKIGVAEKLPNFHTEEAK